MTTPALSSRSPVCSLSLMGLDPQDAGRTQTMTLHLDEGTLRRVHLAQRVAQDLQAEVSLVLQPQSIGCLSVLEAASLTISGDGGLVLGAQDTRKRLLRAYAEISDLPAPPAEVDADVTACSRMERMRA